MKTYLHGPTDYAKKLKLRLRVGDLDLPEERYIPVVGRRRTCYKYMPVWHNNRK